MSLSETRLKLIETMNDYQIIDAMGKWGYTSAKDPGYRNGDLWWAGWTKNNKTVYEWGRQSRVIKKSAIKALKECP